MASGIVIIPEGSKKGISIRSGKPYEMSNISKLGDMLRFAAKRDCVVLYLTSYYGIVSEDSIIGDSVLDLRKIGPDKFKKWSFVICEEIVRSCIEYDTRKVYLLCKEYYKFREIISGVKGRGVNLVSPLLGKKDSLRREILNDG